MCPYKKKKGHKFITHGPYLKNSPFLNGISHGEDAVSLASATMRRRTARLATVRSCTHTAAMAVAGQVLIVSRGARRRSGSAIKCFSERKSTRTRAPSLLPVAQNVVCKSACNDPLSGLILTVKFGRCCPQS
jgi:hypothetical protein